MARYPLTKITNISGSAMEFPWLPNTHGGRLANGGSITVHGDLITQLKPRDMAAYGYAIRNSLLRVEDVPAVDGAGEFEREVGYGVNFPDSDVATYTTGAQAHLINATCPSLLKVVSASFQVLGGPVQADHVDGDSTRAIAIYNGADKVAGWMNIHPTGSSALTAGDWREFAFLDATECYLTTGDSLTVHVTAGNTAHGATGYVRVRCVAYT